MSEPSLGAELARLRAEEAILRAARARRRRLGSGCFFAAGLGFGTALYFLRARFHTLHSDRHALGLLGLLAGMISLFWLGARAESEVARLDARLAAIEEERAAALRRR